MVPWLINWRRNLFMLMLFLLFINSFSFHSKQFCLGWWLEHQHLSGQGFQVVRRSVTVSSKYVRFQLLFKRPFFKILKKLISIFVYYFLIITGWLWIKTFRYFISHLTPADDCRTFSFIWEEPVDHGEKSLIMRVGVSVCSDLAMKTVSGLYSAEERIQITEKVEFLPFSSPVAAKEYLSPGTPEEPPVLRCSMYDTTIENEIRKFYNTLSEKDRRRYAGIEAMKLERGGIVYISNVLGCCRKTVSKGIIELKKLPNEAGYEKQIRKSGGGRKSYREIWPNIDNIFFDVLRDYTAGDPMKEGAVWTNLSYERIAEEIERKHDIKISTKVIRQLIKEHKFGKRKIQKKTTMKQVKNRNAQFENIAFFKTEYQKKGNPIISMDSKKKEDIGNFFRPGYLYTQTEHHSYDHDFKSFSKGVSIPHSLYDLTKNTGWINLGTSKDTSEFACDSLRKWWYNRGRYDYPNATSLLILCDGGGSNNSRHYLFKEDLQKLADEIRIEIRIAHYPPYTSKYNPIEHRMFPHVTRACQGVIFDNIETVKKFMEKAKTKTGLEITVQIIDKIYETGRKVQKGFKENMPIIFDEYLSNWNYRAIPNGKVI